MSVSVTFFNNFSKRDNSTATPVISTGVVVNAELKDSTSVLSPTVLISGSWTNDRSGYNYFYIPKFDRYYHVTDIVYNRGMVEISGTVDVLASWRSWIGGSTQYVLRAATSSYWNGDIIDTYYPTENGLNIVHMDIRNSGSLPPLYEDKGNYFNGTAGTVVVGIRGPNLSGSYSARGGITYYIMSPYVLAQFMEWLLGYSSTSVSFMGEIKNVFGSDNQLQLFYNGMLDTFQFIDSVKYYPFSYRTGTSVNSILVGPVNLSINPNNAIIITGNGCYNDTVTLTIPKHPQAATRGAYLNGEPYSRYYVNYAPFGTFGISSDELKDYDTIVFDISVDMIVGEGCLGVYAYKSADPTTIYQVKRIYGNVGVECIVAGNQKDPNALMSMLGAGVSGATNAAQGNIGGIFSSINAAIGSGLNALKIKNDARGSIGSLVGYYSESPEFVYQYQTIPDANDSDAGRPVCQRLTISSLSGYVQCAEGDISCPATQQEREQIKSYLTGGFYYE